jgi:hypothetical protein
VTIQNHKGEGKAFSSHDAGQQCQQINFILCLECLYVDRLLAAADELQR